MNKFKNSYSLITALAIMIIFVILRLSPPPKNILSYDVFGYYLYLPATFIYDDPGIKDIGWVEQANEKYDGAPSLYQLARAPHGNYIIRFYAGISLMYAPFFLVGHAVALLTPYEADGFSAPYQWAIIVAGLFYTLFAVWFLRKVLLAIFDDLTTAITLVLIFIGSAVFFFASWGNDAPHVYIFALFTVILWLTNKWYTAPKARYAVALGLITGISVITRPSEVFILFVPILWGIWSFRSMKEKLWMVWHKRRDVLLIVLFAIIGFLPQLMYWKFASGQWIYNSYDDPQSGFNFADPRIAYVLLGFRKGLYIYSPVMIFATLGFIPLFRQKREWFLAILLFFLANIYLISCYSSLISFGWRAFIEIHALMAIPLACLVSWTLKQKNVVRVVLLLFLFLVLALNLFKSWQIRRGIIDGSRMTREYYLDSFFSTNPKKTNKDLLLVDRSEESIEHMGDPSRYNRRVLAVKDFEDPSKVNPKQLDSIFVHQGKYALRLDSANIFSQAIEIPFKDITKNYYAWIRASVWVYKTGDPDASESLLCIHFNYDKRPYKYRAISFENQGLPFKPGEWNKLSIDYMTPEVRTISDPLKVYVWFRGKGEIYIDDLEVEVFEPKKIQSY